MNDALGLLEVAGLLAAVTAGDAMVKAANVNVLGIEKAKGQGWMTVKVSGDVAAVQAAIEAGAAVATSLNLFVAKKVIPRPTEGLVETFTNDFGPRESIDKEEPVNEDTPSVPESVGLNQKAVEVMEEIVSKIVDPKVEPKSTKKPSTKKNPKQK